MPGLLVAWRGMGWLLALWVGLAAPVDAGSEVRPPAEYSLDWQAPAECPSAEEIEAQVGALTDDQLDGEGTMLVRGVVRYDDAGRYRLELTTTVGEREAVRELEATDCVDLGEAVALVVALTLVPSLGEAPEPEFELDPEPEPEPEPPVTVEPVETPQPPSSPPARPEPARSRRGITPPAALLRAGLGLDIGSAPASTFASRLAIGVAWTHLRVAIEGTHLVPQRADGLAGAADGLVQQGTVGLVGCGVLALQPWSFPICGGVETGFLRADSRGLTPRRTSGGAVFSPLARIGVVRHWRRVGLWMDAEGLVRAVSTRVVLEGEEIFRPAAGSVRFLAGIEFRLGETAAAGQ